jgi:hypothetical protein
MGKHRFCQLVLTGFIPRYGTEGNNQVLVDKKVYLKM